MLPGAQRARSLRLRVAATILCALAGGAFAQSTPGPLREGPGRVIGRIVHPDGPARAAGVPVVLYGLTASGEAGVANTTSDERGAFAFDGVSNDPEMAYLVGARYRDIPFFGPRVVFAAGETETTAVVDISDPTPDTSGIGVSEVIVQLEWAGERLSVQEVHRLRSSGDAVVMVAAPDRTKTDPPFEARLPEGASDFASFSLGFEDQLEEQAGRVRYWGPIYPGGQDLRFQYTLPVDPPETTIRLTLPMGADGLSVLTAVGGPRVASPGPLAPAEEIELEGRRLRVQRVTDVAAGATIEFGIALPATSSDVTRIGIGRSDVWVEYDDIQLSVNLQLLLQVEGSEPIRSSGGEPVFRVPLTAGAELLELSNEARALGAEHTNGEIVLRGPIPPGDSSFTVRYRLVPTPEGAELELRYPREVKTLNVLVADTGIAIESDRLHRRRPFRQGTRIYLHREGFHVAANETVRVGLRPLSEPRLGSRTSLGLTLASVIAAAFFLAQPLIRARAASVEPEQTAISIRRDALYQDIRDLDHDFETGKLTEADHREMRWALRARAVELLRSERQPDTATAPESESAAVAVCPSCTERVELGWGFCPGCGAQLGDDG